MLIKCDICGKEFDHTEASLSDCGCSCGEPRPKCPECGFDIIIPDELKEVEEKRQQDNSIFNKMEEELSR